MKHFPFLQLVKTVIWSGNSQKRPGQETATSTRDSRYLKTANCFGSCFGTTFLLIAACLSGSPLAGQEQPELAGEPLQVEGILVEPPEGSQPARPVLRTFAELMEIANNSDVKFEVDAIAIDTEKAKAVLESLDTKPMETAMFPHVVTSEDGSASLSEWVCNGASLETLSQAEEQFAAKDFAAARKLYLKALEEDSNCYMAQAHLGDTYFREENYSKAVDFYSGAIELNPMDHKTLAYRGNAFLHLGRLEEALEDFRESLVLRPHYWLIESILKNSPSLPWTFLDLRLRFPVSVESSSAGSDSEESPSSNQPPEAVRISAVTIGETPEEIAMNASVQIAYGLCQGLWVAGEGLSQTEVAEPNKAPARETFFDGLREVECTGAALGMYAAKSEGEGDPSDPTLDIALKAAQEGFLEEVVLYGIAAQKAAESTLLLGSQVRDRMRLYVRQFVLFESPEETDTSGLDAPIPDPN